MELVEEEFEMGVSRPKKKWPEKGILSWYHSTHIRPGMSMISQLRTKLMFINAKQVILEV